CLIGNDDCYKCSRFPVVLKGDFPGVVDCRPGQRAPAKNGTWIVLDNFTFPCQLSYPLLRGSCPARGLFVNDLHRFDVLHELRKILQSTPEGIHLVAWPVNGQRCSYVYVFRALVRGNLTQAIIYKAIAGYAA